MSDCSLSAHPVTESWGLASREVAGSFGGRCETIACAVPVDTAKAATNTDASARTLAIARSGESRFAHASLALPTR